MNWILDIAVLAIIVLTIVFAVKKGFIKTLINSVSFLLALLVTICFAGRLADVLKNTAIAKGIENSTETVLQNIVDDSMITTAKLFDGTNEKLNSLLKTAGLTNSDILKGRAPESVSIADASKTIAKPVTDVIALVLAVIILFLGTKLLLSLVSWLLTKIMKLPVLKKLNKSLGFILGVILAVVRVCLFCFIVTAITNNSDFLGIKFLQSIDPSKTLIYKYFAQIDLFGFLR